MEQEIWQAYKNKGVQVLALAVAERDADPNLADPAIKLKAFRDRHKVTYPLLSDEDQSVFNRFGGGSIPSCVLIDQQGKFVTRIDADLEAVKAQIEQLQKNSH